LIHFFTELANKLGDLTIQAKAMLARNEEMEAQLSEAQMECEDLQNNQEGNTDFVSLRENYEDALEIIQQLRNDEGDQDNESTLNNSKDMRRLEEENLELKEVVDHLVSDLHIVLGFLMFMSCSHI
jgi:TolA-binding protein